MNWEETARAIVLAAVVVLAAVDVVLLRLGGVRATFSRVVLEEAKRHPIIAFAAGVLCGHLFWPQ